jgi:hypothetical protein
VEAKPPRYRLSLNPRFALRGLEDRTKAAGDVEVAVAGAVSEDIGRTEAWSCAGNCAESAFVE